MENEHLGRERLGSRTARAMVWVYASYIGGRALTLLSKMAILARLLGPREFGLVALALIVTVALETLKDLGLTQALIVATDEETEKRAPTVFFLTVAMGFVLWGVTAALAPLMAEVFDEPRVTPILIALGFNFVLRALSATHAALAAKSLDFRKRTFAEAGDVAVRGLVSIGLALAGAGVWSIVVGYLVGTATLVVVLWVMVEWRPRLELRLAGLSRMVRFGGSITGIDVMVAVNRNVDLIAVGAVLGTVSLGLYTLAYRIPELLVLNFAVVGGYVLFPAFATLDREALRAAYLVAFRYTVALALPLTVAMVVLAHPIVLVVFGEQWVGAVGAMQLLALFALTIAIDIPAGTVYKSSGRADVLLKLAIPRALVVAGLMALFVDEGIATAALIQLVVGVGFVAIQLYLTKRLLGAGFRVLAVTAAPIALATAAMGAAAAGLDYVIAGPWPSIAAASAVGAFVYLGTLRVAAPDLVSGLIERLKPTAATPMPPVTREGATAAATAPVPPGTPGGAP